MTAMTRDERAAMLNRNMSRAIELTQAADGLLTDPDPSRRNPERARDLLALAREWREQAASISRIQWESSDIDLRLEEESRSRSR